MEIGNLREATPLAFFPQEKQHMRRASTNRAAHGRTGPPRGQSVEHSEDAQHSE